MAETAGIVIEYGFTEQKALRELARIEAAAARSAKKAEAAAKPIGDGITAGAKRGAAAVNDLDTAIGRMSRNSQQQLQNVSYQFQDVLVQISSGTSATRALGQQLPQLLSGFGALGGVLGLAAAAAIPLIGMLGSGSDNAKELAEAVDALEASVRDYRSAVGDASASTSDLVEKYGLAAGAARDLYEQVARLARLEATRDLQAGIKELTAGFSGIKDTLDTIDAEKALGLEDSGLIAGAVKSLNDAYGLTVEQARELMRLLTDAQTAQSVHDKARAVGELSRFLEGAVGSGDQLKTSMLDGAQAAAKTALSAYELAEATNGAERAATGLATAVANVDFTSPLAEARSLADVLSGAANFAQSLGRRMVESVRAGDTAAANSGIFDLIKRRESGGNYNATLDNGAYTGGQRDLVNMTINEVLEMQRQMLAHPANKKNSSAAGAYQIVRKTLQGLVDELGLSGDELYSREMQDRLAAQLLRRRRGQGMTGLRNEWEGLKYVDDATLQKAMGQQSVPLVDPEAARVQEQAASKAASAAERAANEAERKAEAENKARLALSESLIAQQKAADIDRQRADQIAAINAGPGSDAEKAAAIAQVNAEMQRQITIMALTEEAKRRQVDLDAQMVGSTMTYRQAIEALGETAAQKVIADQQMAASAEQLAAAQDFANDKMQTLQDGFIDAIIAGESFADVLKNVAAQMAKAWAQAALFGNGPLGGQGGGGLFAGLFKDGGLLSQVFGGFRASGGPVSSGRAYVVGERGPEIIVPRAPGQVIPNHKLGGSGGSMSMVIDLRGTTGDDALDRKMQAAGARILAQAKAQAPGWVADNQKRRG